MATEEYGLIAKVDATSANKASRDLDQFTASAAKADAANAKLSDGSKASAASLSQHADSATRAERAVAELGETEQQAQQRIHSMVQASLAARNAAMERMQAERAASESLTGMSQAEAAALAERRAAVTALQRAQNAQMTTATEMARAQGTLDAIMGASKMTTAEVIAAEDALDTMRERGLVSIAATDQAIAHLAGIKVVDTAVTKASTKANLENAAAVKLNGRATRELGTMMSEVATGNFGRLRRSSAAFTNQMGLFSKLLTPVGLGLTAVAVAAGATVVAFAKGEGEITAYNKALALTGGYAGQTAGQLQIMAEQLEGVGGATQHAAAGVIAQVVQSGKFFGDQVKTVAAAALELQQSTGQAVDKTIADFEKLGRDPVKGILDLNQSMHFLTQATYDQVTALDQRGEKDKAAEVAQKAYAAAVHQRAQDVQNSLGTLQRAWHGIGDTAKWAWDQMMDIGRPDTLASKIGQYQYQIELAQKTLAKGGLSKYQQGQVEKTIAALQARLTQLQNQQRAAGGFEAGQNLANRLIGERIAAQQALSTGAGASAQGTLQKRLGELAEQKAKALLGVVDPDKRQQIIDEFNSQVAQAAKTYNDAQKRLSPPTSGSPRHISPGALATFAGQVNAMQDRTIGVQGNAALTDYVRAMAKLNDEFDKAIAKGADLNKAQALYDQGAQSVAQKLQKETEAQKAQSQAAQMASDALIAAQKRQIDLQVESVGMGQKEIQRTQQLAQIEAERAQAIEKINEEMVIHNKTLDEMRPEIDRVNARFDALKNNMIDGYHRIDEAQKDWHNGLVSGFQDVIDQGANVAGMMHDTVTDAFGGMTDAVVNFVQTGKFSLKDLADSFISDMVRMEMKVLESQLLQQIFGAFATGPSGYNMGYFGAYSQSATDSTAAGIVGNIMGGYADGGVFDSRGLVKFAQGGIVSSPTLFKFASGTGLMGEAGPEAIVPLTRGSDGKLGVNAQGLGGDKVNLTVVLRNEGGDQMKAKQTGVQRRGNNIMAEFVLQTVAGDTGRGGITAKAFEQRYGLQRRGVPVGA